MPVLLDLFHFSNYPVFLIGFQQIQIIFGIILCRKIVQNDSLNYLPRFFLLDESHSSSVNEKFRLYSVGQFQKEQRVNSFIEYCKLFGIENINEFCQLSEGNCIVADVVEK